MSEHGDQFEEREDDPMTQDEPENDPGSGGGDVDDDETMDEARERSGGGESDPGADEPWAKTSSGDADEV